MKPIRLSLVYDTSESPPRCGNLHCLVPLEEPYNQVIITINRVTKIKQWLCDACRQQVKQNDDLEFVFEG